METWLLILLIVLGVAILVIIVSAITYKCMKYGVDIQTQPVVEKRSIYCSSDLNKVAKVDYSSSIYGQPQAVNSNGRALDKDGFQNGEIVRVDMRQKRIWKENSFQFDVEGKSAKKTQIGSKIHIGEQELLTEGKSSVRQLNPTSVDAQKNPFQPKPLFEAGQKPIPAFNAQPQSTDKSKMPIKLNGVVKVKKQARIGAFSKLMNPNSVAVKTPQGSFHSFGQIPNPEFRLQTDIANNRTPVSVIPPANEVNFESNNSQSQGQQFLRGLPQFVTKPSEKEYMFQTNKSMNNKVAELQQKAVSHQPNYLANLSPRKIRIKKS